MEFNEKKVSIKEIGPLIEEQIKSDNQVKLRVSGNSMFPFFRDQETTVTLVALNRPLKRRDVVFYYTQNQKYILHRIVRIKNDILFIRGDALKKIEMIPLNNVIALVSSYERQGRNVRVEEKKYHFLVFLWMGCIPLRGLLIRIIKKCIK